MAYTIGQMAEKLGLTASTLRYYEKEGLLPFVERTPGGTRIFHDADMSWFRVIDCLKKTGMPLKDIKRFIDWTLEGDATVPDRLALIGEQRRRVEEQIDELEQKLEFLRYKEWYYTVAREAGTVRAVEDVPLDEMPEQFRKFR